MKNPTKAERRARMIAGFKRLNSMCIRPGVEPHESGVYQCNWCNGTGKMYSMAKQEMTGCPRCGGSGQFDYSTLAPGQK